MSRHERSNEIVLSAVNEAVRTARRLDISEYEVFAYSDATKRVGIEADSVNSAESALVNGLMVRVVNCRRVGTAFRNTFERSSIAHCVKQALSSSAISDDDPNWPGFASSVRRYPQVEGICDKSVKEVALPDLSLMAEEMIQGAIETKRGVKVAYGRIDAGWRTLAIANSAGIDAWMEGTRLTAMCSTVRGSGSSVTPDCVDVRMSRKCDIDLGNVGRMAAIVAVWSSRIVKAATGEFETVFSPLSLGENESGLLSVILAKAISGQNAVKRASFLEGRVGQQIASDCLTIRDNPALRGKCGSRPFDDEGIPTSRVELIRNGVLKRFVWDSRSGSLAGRQSSGNAVRNYSTGAVAAAPLNLQISRGRGSMEDLISEVDKGYFVWNCQGSHTANPETGELSFVVSPGFLVERGEIVGGVRGAMVSGNLQKMLLNVTSIGSDAVDFGFSIVPSICLSEVKVTAG